MNAGSRRDRPPILPLTSLRYVAAVGVVFYHLYPKTGDTPAVIVNALSMSGSVAVCFFFVLSGFILIYSDVTDSGQMRKSRKAFWWTRFGRIYPVYLLAFIVAGPATYFGLAKHGTSGALERMLVYGVAAVTLLQSWSPFTAGSWNAPGWSLSTEAFFYATFPWLTRMSHWKDLSLSWILLLLWLLASAPTIGLHLHYHETSRIPELVSKAWKDMPLLRLPDFAAGMILGIFWMRHRDSAAKSAPASPWPLLVLFTAIAAYLCFGPEWLHPLVLVPLFLLLIGRCAVDRSTVSRCLSHPVLVRLGQASYAVYILHIPIFVYWHSLLHPQAVSAMFVFAYLVIITCISLGVYAWAERPLAKWVRQRLAHVPGPEPLEERLGATEAVHVLEPQSGSSDR